jgi:hypothetical protein
MKKHTIKILILFLYFCVVTPAQIEYTLIFPPANTSMPFYNMRFSWKKVPQATSYTFQAVADERPDVVIYYPDVQDTVLLFSCPGGENLKFTWQIKANIPNKDSVNWSQKWSFTAVSNLIKPVLKNPANNSINQPTTINLSWEAVKGADAYQLQISEKNDFTALIYDDSLIAEPSKRVSGLNKNKQYYWRVNARNAGEISQYSDTWSFQTLTSTVSIDDFISYAQDSITVPIKIQNSENLGAVTLYIKIDTSVVKWGRVEKADSGFSGFIGGLNGDMIVLTGYSVNAMSISNGALAECRLFYKGSKSKTFLQFAKQFCQISDINGNLTNTNFIDGSIQLREEFSAELCSPKDNSIDNDTSLLLKWKRVENAANYILQISADSLFSEHIINSSVIQDTLFYMDNLSHDKFYFWRVKAFNYLDTGKWSETWKFKTKKISIILPPVLLKPGNYSTVAFNFVFGKEPILFNWSKVDSVLRYKLQVSSDSFFKNIVVDTIVNKEATGVSLSYFENCDFANINQFYWRVRGENENGIGDYSALWSFYPLLPPKLIFPGNEENITSEISFKWGRGANAEKYYLNIYKDSTLTQVLFRQMVNDTFYVFPNGVFPWPELKKCFWQVYSYASEYSQSGSEIWSFTRYSESDIKPEPPLLFLPRDNTKNNALQVTFSWIASSRALSYELQVATDDKFTNIVFCDSSIITTSRALSGLNYDTKYYWRVNAKNSIGISNFSTVWSFSTISYLVSPINNSTIILNLYYGREPILFTWLKIDSTSRYRLQVSSDTVFTKIIIDTLVNNNSSEVSLSYFEKNDITNIESFYWRIRRETENGHGNYSSYWSFKTFLPTKLVLPENGSNVINGLIFRWRGVVKAVSYKVFLYNDSTRLQSASFPSVKDTFYVFPNGFFPWPELKKCYWQIYSYAPDGSQSMSALWNFTRYSETDIKPEPPLLYMPRDNSDKIAPQVTLSWKASSGALSYGLQIATDENFNNIVLYDSLITTTSRTIAALYYDTKYYWRVNARNYGGVSNFSSVWKFLTIMQKPVLISPADGSVGASRKLLLLWRKNPKSEHYRLQVASDSPFSNLLCDSLISDSSFVISGLSPQQLYYWRVRNERSDNISDYSDAWSFTTGDCFPPPVLLKPENGAAEQPVALVLNWSHYASASSYNVLLAEDSNFIKMKYAFSDLINDSIQVAGLEHSRVYYWKIRAKIKNDFSDFSETRNFITCNPSVRGKLVYSNLNSTPLKNVSVMLKNQNTVVRSSVTDNEGNFLFSSVPNGLYDFQADNKIGWGGVNSTDALLVMRDFTGNSPLTGLNLKTADVDNSGTVNSTDALLIMKRFDGIINSFPAGDWAYDKTQLMIFGTYYEIKINALCAGDVNSSYYFSALKKADAPSLTNEGVMKIGKNNAVDIPFCIKNNCEIGAVSLTLNYNKEEIKPISINAKIKNAVTVIENGKISIAWNDVNACRIKSGEPIFILRAVPLKLNMNADCFLINPESEIADKEGVAIKNIDITYPKITYSIPTEFSLEQNYPNPFNPATKISFSIPEECHVNLSVYNSLGQAIKVLVDGNFSAGFFDKEFDGSPFSSGVYFYVINAKSSNGSNNYYCVKKAILAK